MWGQLDGEPAVRVRAGAGQTSEFTRCEDRRVAPGQADIATISPVGIRYVVNVPAAMVWVIVTTTGFSGDGDARNGSPYGGHGAVREDGH